MKKSRNIILIEKDVITVTTKKGEQIYFSKEDLEFVCSHTFYVNKTGYAATNIKENNKYICKLAHRVLMNCPNNKEIHHINKITLDNRRSNLQILDSKEHRPSLLQLPAGVSYDKNYNRKKPYAAKIRIKGRKVFLGYYLTAEEAHKSYINAKIAKQID